MRWQLRLKAAIVLWLSGLIGCVPSALLRAQQPQGAPATIVVEVNRVLVPVVVRDAHGHVLSDLKKEDFQVFDNDKPRIVSGFTAQKRATVEVPASSLAGAPTAAAASSALPLAPPPASAPVEAQRLVVFLFDDMHLSFEDMVPSTKAAVQVLDGTLSGTDVAAVVSTSGKTNSGLTRDRVKLKEAIASLQPRGIYRSSAADCPKIDYYQAGLIANKHDSAAFQDAVRQVFSCNPAMNASTDMNMAESQADSAARRVLALGNQDVLSAYAAVREFVQRMAALPGERLIILISPGFLTVAPEALSEQSRLIDFAAQSNVTISALDARGLYTTNLDTAQHSPSLRDMNGAGGSVQLQSDYRQTGMSLAEGTMASLSDGTGGTFFHNSNDLSAGLKELAAVPDCVYVLELPLDGVKADGSYHRLKVKVLRGRMDVQARRGYFVPKKGKDKK